MCESRCPWENKKNWICKTINLFQLESVLKLIIASCHVASICKISNFLNIIERGVKSGLSMGLVIIFSKKMRICCLCEKEILKKRIVFKDKVNRKLLNYRKDFNPRCIRKMLFNLKFLCDVFFLNTAFCKI